MVHPWSLFFSHEQLQTPRCDLRVLKGEGKKLHQGEGILVFSLVVSANPHWATGSMYSFRRVRMVLLSILSRLFFALHPIGRPTDKGGSWGHPMVQGMSFHASVWLGQFVFCVGVPKMGDHLLISCLQPKITTPSSLSKPSKGKQTISPPIKHNPTSFFRSF